ncbi:molybdopterin oxidoreductase family protein [Novosphingobium sp. MD-1]|uniref:molybdopterin oxidoreductase family protein n=1 Tax=Novosphingobium sp. MD-1 TaxID=1630648 RepID=UPI00061BCD62|nr:molybdopterin oxidoreductase family protein [Novosphingobium sp. MD-1]GAO53749.1 anaerobic dehydrogenases, typically selenocysteine-containing [Novosphingobium sp. MD-1]
MRRIHHRTCHICEANCGILVETEDRAVLSIKGDPDNPLSRGHICPKATALQDLQEDPDRLRRPVKRVGETWHEISWQQAFAEIGQRTRAILAEDPDASAVYIGNPNAHSYGNALNAEYLSKALHTRNKFSASTVDQMPHQVANLRLFGHASLFGIPDIDRTQTLIILGGNPMASNGSIWTVPDFRNRARELRQRGGTLIVVDPRRTETARVADRHLFIRPATDAFFLVALLKAVLARRPARPVQDFITGLADVAAALERFDAAACGAACGVAAEDIDGLAERMTQGPAVLYGRMGVATQAHGTLNAWLIGLINIAAGQLDREGGIVFPLPALDTLAILPPGSIGKHRSRVSGHRSVLGELPAAAMAEEIETPGPGRLRALFVVAGNPVLSTPNGARLDKALSELDLMVSIDMYRNATSRRAHYILPPVGPLERDHYGLFLLPMAVRTIAAYSPPTLAPEDGTLQDWEILRGLAGAITGEPVQAPTPRETLDALLRSGPYAVSLADVEAAPSGLDFGPPAEGRLPERLRTPHKTVACADPECLEALAALEVPETSAGHDGALLLIGRRHLRTNNSWLANSRRMTKGPNRCTLMIHPDDATARGIADGETATVRSRAGSIALPAEVTEDIMPGTVSIPHGWGHGLPGIAMQTAKAHAGVSVNDLTDETAIDPLSGNAALSGVRVEVSAFEEATA